MEVVVRKSQLALHKTSFCADMGVEKGEKAQKAQSGTQIFPAVPVRRYLVQPPSLGQTFVLTQFVALWKSI